MPNLTIYLKKEEDGRVRTTLGVGQGGPVHLAEVAAVKSLQEAALKLSQTFETGGRPLADPVALHDLGKQLKSTLLEPFWEQMEEQFCKHDGSLLISTSEPDLLNLPWELLPSATSVYLVADGRWSIRRTTHPNLQESALGKVALPLRILFVACAPIDQAGLDYEKEEEAMLQLATRLGTRVHLSIAEAGSFDELRNLISELKPHVVHLSGHGVVQEGIGYFTFEDERGQSDQRDARSMAEQLFAARGVRVVFVSGCQTSEAASGGICQSLTAAGHVPVALGWGASIADGPATEFARIFYHELASGRSVDASVATARRELLSSAHLQIGEEVFFDASFALPQIYAADATNEIIDEKRPREKVDRPGVKYALLGDNIIGLKEGFVGRRRLLQRLRPGLRAGDFHVLLLTGMGGAGKSTLATRLANRCVEEGFHLVALKATRDEPVPFSLRLVQEIGVVCRKLGSLIDYDFLNDGKNPLQNRLRVAVEILKEAKILLVLDNLEDLMPLPPSVASWEDDDMRGFFRELFSRLTGEGRCILTCRYIPEGFDATRLELAHEPLPDFSEAEFIKCLSRNERVVERMTNGEITQNVLSLLHRKIGGTPRFVKLSADLLATTDVQKLESQLRAAPDLCDSDDVLREIREKYLNDLFLPELYQGLSPEHRVALSRVALVELPIPVDGVAKIAGLAGNEVEAAIGAMLSRGLLQRLGEEHEVALYATYPLQRGYLTCHSSNQMAQEGHRAAAAFFKSCFDSDREPELRVSFTTLLFACRDHAGAGTNLVIKEWATIKIGRLLYDSAEFRTALGLLMPLAQESSSPELFKLLADCLESVSQWSKAKHYYSKALTNFQIVGEQAGVAATLHSLAVRDIQEGAYASARDRFAQAKEIMSAVGDEAGVAATLHSLAAIDLNEENFGEARKKFLSALQMLHSLGDQQREEAAILANLSVIDLHEGDRQSARMRAEQAIEVLERLGDRVAKAGALHNLASIDLDEAKYAPALEKFIRVLKMRQAIGDRAGEANTLGQISFIAWENNMREAAVRLQALSFIILDALSASTSKTSCENLNRMARKMGLSQESFDAMMQDATSRYKRDRADSLISEVLKNLMPP